MKKILLVLALLVSATGVSYAQSSASPVVTGYWANAPQTNCPVGPCFIQYGSTLPVTASISGFAPNGSVANLSVTSTTSDVALPTGATVVVTNKGSTTAYIKLSVGAGTAATTDMALVAGAAVGFTVGSNTFINAITAGSDTTSLSIAGGTGLVTGYGGGSGGGGGSASNITELGGNPIDLGNGTTGAGTLRVTLSSDGTGQLIVKQATAANLNATVTGTVTANIGTVGTLATAANQTNVQSAPGTPQTVAVTVQGNASGVALPVSMASSPLPTGAATSALQSAVIGTKAAGTAATNSLLTGGVYNSGGVSLTDGQQAATQMNNTGQILVSDPTLQSIASSAIPAGSNIIGKVDIDQTTPGTTNGVVITTAIPAGTNLIGKFGIDQTTPGTTNAIVSTATTTQGLTPYGLQTAASTNSTLVSTGAHTLKGMYLESSSTTVMYLRMYDTAGAPTCSSSTGFIRSFAIPPAASSGLIGGVMIPLPPEGVAYSSGISFCVTGGASNTDNTNATTGGLVNLDYK